MEKMYKEVTDIKTQMALRDDIAKIETTIENDVIDKVCALYDNREIQAEINSKYIKSHIC